MGGIFLGILIGGVALAAAPSVRVNKNNIALCESRDSKSDADCYDAVSYVKDNKAEKVSEENGRKFRFEHEGAIYVFASQAHLDLFKKDPKAYTPEFGGWCAYAVSKNSSKVDIDPQRFHIQNGRLLLFYDGLFADTRKTWLSDKDKNPEAYLKEADLHWPAVKGKEP